jgi:NitT/TauT family transport system substrate-binding protein
VLAASRRTIEDDPGLVGAVVRATTRGYAFAVQHPEQALGDLVRSVPTLDRAEQSAQMRVLLPDLLPAPFCEDVLRGWARWDLEQGLLEKPIDVDAAFERVARCTPS